MKGHFFTKDKEFYHTLRELLILTILHNLIAYATNAADNIMLGSYSENAAAGAAAVNQLFFLVQQLAVALGFGLVITASRYWGEKNVDPIRTLTGTILRIALVCSLIVVALCFCLPGPLLRLFASNETAISEGRTYLSIVQWTFPLFMASTIFASAFRSVGSARTGFKAAVAALFIKLVLNALLINGHLGFPALGICGAAAATLAARIIELMIFLYYLAKDTKMHLFSRLKGPGGFFTPDSHLRSSLLRVTIPVTIGIMLWSFSVPLQGVLIGQVSDEAAAANAAASTFYQMLKVVVTAMTSVSCALIGHAIGSARAQLKDKGHKAVRDVLPEVYAKARTLSVVNVLIGLVLGLFLLLSRGPLLSLYDLSAGEMQIADHLVIILSIIMVGMSFQMPANDGILLGGGDIRFAMSNDLIWAWLIVLPLSLLAAFVWKLPVEWIVLIINCDQIFKCIPILIRLNSSRWVKRLPPRKKQKNGGQ